MTIKYIYMEMMNGENEICEMMKMKMMDVSENAHT
jgi:hypothetical protein